MTALQLFSVTAAYLSALTGKNNLSFVFMLKKCQINLRRHHLLNDLSLPSGLQSLYMSEVVRLEQIGVKCLAQGGCVEVGMELGFPNERLVSYPLVHRHPLQQIYVKKDQILC